MRAAQAPAPTATRPRRGRSDGQALPQAARPRPPVRCGALLIDTSLGIDPEQVYVSGLPSGGGQAKVMGCLAPDVFAGVGIAAGPTVGTTSGQIGSTLAQARSTSRTFAGTHAADFGSQVTSVAAAPTRLSRPGRTPTVRACR